MEVGERLQVHWRRTETKHEKGKMEQIQTENPLKELGLTPEPMQLLMEKPRWRLTEKELKECWDKASATTFSRQET